MRYVVEIMDERSDWAKIYESNTLLEAVDYIYREFQARNPRLVDADGIYELDNDGFSENAVIVICKHSGITLNEDDDLFPECEIDLEFN